MIGKLVLRIYSPFFMLLCLRPELNYGKSRIVISANLRTRPNMIFQFYKYIVQTRSACFS
jgi:hypothetical protein